jgi:RNA polymerase sigma factor (sigma-70 family)
MSAVARSVETRAVTGVRSAVPLQPRSERLIAATATAERLRTVSGPKVGWRRRSRVTEDEITAVFRTHVSSVFGFFSYSVGRDAAEDLTAATFERVVRSWHRFDPTRSSEQTWIFAIARNVLTDHLRRQRHRAGPSLDAQPAILETMVFTEDPLAAALSLEAVNDWLQDLRPRERQVLALRYCADLSVREIAGCIGVSEANVHQICSRALRQLRAVADERRRVSDSG